jgi:hypothetical protein
VERAAPPPDRDRDATAEPPRELVFTIKGREPEGASLRVELAAAAVTASALLLADLAGAGESLTVWLGRLLTHLDLAAAPALPVWAAALLTLGGHLLLVRPVAYAIRRLRSDDARLRAALACPYCKDHLPPDSAVACERTGCGAHYHLDCWSECRRDYGGCAIFGCGSKDGREVGSFALTRRLVWQLIATALFPPKLAKRASPARSTR